MPETDMDRVHRLRFISFHFKYFIDKSIGYAYTNPLQQQDGTIRTQFT